MPQLSMSRPINDLPQALSPRITLLWCVVEGVVFAGAR
ncbi:hypothetical protein NG2371_03523 [Nocardia gamkensis]|nr:hypothetical protein [Nocardia gamkensis]